MMSIWSPGSWFASFRVVAVLALVALAGASYACGGASEDLTPVDGADESARRVEAVDPIAEADADWPGHVTQILELIRIDDGILQLRFAILNHGPEGTVTSLEALGSAPGDEGTVADVHLVDPEGTKKYFVLRDAEGRALCSRDLEPLASGGRVELWARFPAPADDVASIDVYVPRAPAFVGVPIPPRSPTVSR